MTRQELHRIDPSLATKFTPTPERDAEASTGAFARSTHQCL
jgi:hypothetical protein